MRPWRVVGLLFLLSALILLCVPPLRHAIPFLANTTAGRAELPSQTEYEAVALAHPKDAEIWLGYASLAQRCEWMRSLLGTVPEVPQSCSRPAKTTAADAFARAVKLAPNAPAPRFHYALYLLGASGSLTRADEYASPPPEPAEPHTAAQEANLQAAEDALIACRAMAPDNAACDYLLASTYYAQHDDEIAFAAAQRGAAKTLWTTYQREAALAQWKLFDNLPNSGRPRVSFQSTPDATTGARVRSVARILQAKAEKFRMSGDHRRAIVNCECIIRLGRLVRVNAYSIIDGLVAVAVTNIAAPGSLVPASEWAAAQAVPDSAARVKRIGDLRTEALASYFRRHGRADLAGFYEQESAAAAKWRQVAKTATSRQVGVLVDTCFGDGIAVSFAMWVQCALFAVLGLIVGLGAVVTRCWRRPVEGFGPTYGGWIALLVLSLLPGLLFALVVEVKGLPLQYWANPAMRIMPLAGGTGLLLWMVGVGVVAGRRRAGLSAEERPGRARSFSATIRALVAPTLAALVLLSVIGLSPMAGAEKRINTMYRTIAEQGEVQYWGIDTEQDAPPKARK